MTDYAKELLRKHEERMAEMKSNQNALSKMMEDKLKLKTIDESKTPEPPVAEDTPAPLEDVLAFNNCGLKVGEA